VVNFICKLYFCYTYVRNVHYMNVKEEEKKKKKFVHFCIFFEEVYNVLLVRDWSYCWQTGTILALRSIVI